MFKNLKKKKNNKGFTLVELLVVIAIIGILAVVAVPSLFKNIDKAKATQSIANVKSIQTEVISMYSNGSKFSEITAKTIGENKDILVDLKSAAGETYAFEAVTAANDATATEIKLVVTTTNANILDALKGNFGGTIPQDKGSVKFVVFKK